MKLDSKAVYMGSFYESSTRLVHLMNNRASTGNGAFFHRGMYEMST
jgi:hypothetical protein